MARVLLQKSEKRAVNTLAVTAVQCTQVYQHSIYRQYTDSILSNTQWVYCQSTGHIHQHNGRERILENQTNHFTVQTLERPTKLYLIWFTVLFLRRSPIRTRCLTVALLGVARLTVRTSYEKLHTKNFCNAAMCTSPDEPRKLGK